MNIAQQKSWSISGACPLQPQQCVARLYFATNSASLDRGDYQAMNRLIQCIVARHGAGGAGAMFLVNGHADSRGASGHNDRLSQKRAMQVGRYLKSRLPGTVIYWQALGERYASQPLPLTSLLPDKLLANERRVDVVYQSVERIEIPDGEQIFVPTAPIVVAEATQIAQRSASAHPERSRRILCYLKKLSEAATPVNDSYWLVSDLESGEHLAYAGKRFSQEGLRSAGRHLARIRRSARKFLVREFSDAATELEKWNALLRLDNSLFQCVRYILRRTLPFEGSGGESLFPYWIAIKNSLAALQSDPRSLYSCL